MNNKNKTHKQNIESARITIDRLHQEGYIAYWVGGCVRDMLLGIEADDIDIATNAKPEGVIALFDKTIPVGVKFGVVIVVINGIQVEVATFRKDGLYLDHRHPADVHFSDAEEDAKRRDFTVNGLFYDPVNEQIIDFVGGQNDLKAKIIRGIGDPYQRFKEDSLRMLRAIRFSVRFDFEIEEKTWRSLCELSFEIISISADRVREELIKTLTGQNPSKAVKLLSESGLLKEIFPEIEAMKGVDQPPEFHPEGDVFEHTLLSLTYMNNPSPTLAFATLLHDVGKPATFEMADRIRFNRHDKEGANIADDICRRLNFSNADRKKIVDLIDRHMVFMNIRNMRESKLKRFLAYENFEEDLELHRVDCLASHGNLDNIDFCRQKIAEYANAPIIPTPLINGEDLIAMGFQPGAIFKEILEKCMDAQLEGEFSSKEDAIEFVKINFKL